MKVSLDCIPCFFTQAIKTARVVTSDEKLIKRILNEISISFPSFPFNVSPPEISREVYRILSDLTGVEDPYRKIKRKCIRQALALYPKLKRLTVSSSDPLLTAVKISVAGNVIDFGANLDFNLKRDVGKVLSQDFAVNNYPEFCRLLAKAKNILYIADNAGETVFDRILIEELDRPVVYAVRERPIINDATAEDAYLSGVNKVARIISSGCDTPGTILKFCTDEFLNTYRSSDLIISKGQGNFETLSEEKHPIFFFLKVKCDVVASHLKVEKESILFMAQGQRKRPHSK